MKNSLPIILKIVYKNNVERNFKKHFITNSWKKIVQVFVHTKKKYIVPNLENSILEVESQMT